jgi:hypothetical protein
METLCLIVALVGFIATFYKLKKTENKLLAWQKCAVRLVVYAEEIQYTVTNKSLYEAVCEDIEEYKKLRKSDYAQQ